jgi:hypothetical protein
VTSQDQYRETLQRLLDTVTLQRDRPNDLVYPELRQSWRDQATALTHVLAGDTATPEDLATLELQLRIVSDSVDASPYKVASLRQWEREQAEALAWAVTELKRRLS